MRECRKKNVSLSPWGPRTIINLSEGANFLKCIYNALLVSGEKGKNGKFIIVQSLSHVWLFVTSHTAAHQASLSFTTSWSLLKLMSIELIMLSNHLIPCCLIFLLPSIFPCIRVFSNESALHIRWPKYRSFSFSISPSNEYPGLISFRINWIDFLVVQGTLKTLLQN